MSCEAGAVVEEKKERKLRQGTMLKHSFAPINSIEERASIKKELTVGA